MDSRSLYVGKTTEMRLPRHDTPLSLSVEAPVDALRADEALLEAIAPGGGPLVRWYTVDRAALVLGMGQRAAVTSLVDTTRIEVLERRAGGGLVLLDEHMLCCAVCVALPDERTPADLTESYRWLGDHFAGALQQLGVPARRVEVAEARASVAALKARTDPVAHLLRGICYAALSPHEVVVDGHKIVGFAQIRRKHAALFQIGVLLRDQSPLSGFVRSDAATRAALRTELTQRTIGLQQIISDPIDLSRLIEAL
jgi:lipoate---protein ligase